MTIETMNKFMVGVNSGGLVIFNPPRGPLSDEDALLLAAWLVALTGKPVGEFLDVLKAVQNT